MGSTDMQYCCCGDSLKLQHNLPPHHYHHPPPPSCDAIMGESEIEMEREREGERDEIFILGSDP